MWGPCMGFSWCLNTLRVVFWDVPYAAESQPRHWGLRTAGLGEMVSDTEVDWEAQHALGWLLGWADTLQFVKSGNLTLNPSNHGKSISRNRPFILLCAWNYSKIITLAHALFPSGCCAFWMLKRRIFLALFFPPNFSLFLFLVLQLTFLYLLVARVSALKWSKQIKLEIY